MYVFFVPPKHKLFRGGYKNILAKKKKKIVSTEYLRYYSVIEYNFSAVL